MDDLTRLVAIEEIRLLKARYFRAIDEKSEALLREIFADDVELDYRGSTTDPATGVNVAPGATDTILRGGEHCAKLLAKSLIGIVSVHHGSLGEIEITGEDSARAIWPMVDRLRFGAGSPVAEMVGYGHYHETYARVAGKWRIKTLRLTRLRVDMTAA